MKPDPTQSVVLTVQEATMQLMRVCMHVAADPWQFYDRAGLPISYEQAVELFRSMAYRQVACTIVAGMRVSTVWLAVDHGSESAHLLFETMVFRGAHGRSSGRNPRRYANEAEAFTDHFEVCARVKREMEEAMRDVDI